MGVVKATKGAVVAAVKEPEPPLKGSLYAQLLCSDGGKLALRCSQKLWLAPKTSVKLFTMFQEGQEPRARVQLKHKSALPLQTRLSGRVRYDASQAAVKGTVYLKNKADLGPHTALNAKLELHSRWAGAGKEPVGEVQARLEVSHKALNLTSSQGATTSAHAARRLTPHARAAKDFRIRVGLDLLDRTVYGEVRAWRGKLWRRLTPKRNQVRENRLTVKANSQRQWSVLYDL